MLKGLIVGNISKIYNVEVDGKIYNCTAKGKMRKNLVTPTVGDYVLVDLDGEEGVINDVLDRDNFLKRPKISNLTQIVFVVSLNLPKPDLLLLDKQLVYAKLNKINPIICINKIDLDDEDRLKEICSIYEKIGYKVLKTNAKKKEGIADLKNLLEDNITAFSGNSGVGKSTLLNAIFDKNMADEGDISKKNSRGKNTTTVVRLYKLCDETYIADTPGFSTFELEHDEVTSDNLDKYFIEFTKYIKKCEYIGCNHIKEINCGVKDALENGLISKERYENYCRIYNKLKEKEDYRWK